MSEVLQPQVTMSEALLDGMRTYRNGCNFKLIIKSDRSAWLDYGCYCLVNLATGAERLLVDWLGRGNKYAGPKRLDVKPETIQELLRRKPCQCCGGSLHEARDS
jgi:hypothetical protein